MLGSPEVQNPDSPDSYRDRDGSPKDQKYEEVRKGARGKGQKYPI